MEERELDQILGGAPREVVEEFPKPGELSEDDLMNVLAGGPNREVMVNAQLQHEELFRPTAVENEMNAMLQELGQQEQVQTNQHKM